MGGPRGFDRDPAQRLQKRYCNAGVDGYWKRERTESKDNTHTCAERPSLREYAYQHCKAVFLAYFALARIGRARYVSSVYLRQVHRILFCKKEFM